MNPRTASLVILTLGAIAAWVLLELLLRKDRTWRSWLVDGVIVAGVLLACRLVLSQIQVRVLAVVAASLLVGLLLIAVIVLVRFMGSIATLRRRVLRELPVERFESAEFVLPEQLRRVTAECERLGFRSITTTIDKFGGVVAHLLRVQDVVIAETDVDPTTNVSTLNLTSVLDGGRGMLVTRSSGLEPLLWDAEFVQAFPGAISQHLLANHDDGLSFLRDHGIAADVIEPEQLMAVRTEMVTRSASAARAASRKVFRQEAARILRDQHAAVGRLRDRPEVQEQIERFLRHR